MTINYPTFEQISAWSNGSKLGEVEATGRSSEPTEHEVRLAAIESEECGYTVTPGFTYCRPCAGSGLRPETREDCITCGARGQNKVRN